MGNPDKVPGVKEFRVEDCLKRMLEFVMKHNLRHIIGKGSNLTAKQWGDKELVDKKLREQLQPQAEIAAKLTSKLAYINRELTMNLTILSLYDLAVLIGESPNTC